MNPSQYVKAFVGAVVAGGGSAVTALQDGHVTSGEAVAIIVATAVGFGAVFQIPNASPPDTVSGPTALPSMTTGIIRPQTNGLATEDDPPSGALPTADPGAPDGATEVR